MDIGNLRIAAKLWLAVGALILALLGLTTVSLYRTSVVQDEADQSLKAISARIDAATHWASLTEINATRTQALILSGDAVVEAAFKDPITATTAQISDVQKSIEAMDLGAQDKAQMQKIAGSRKAMIDLRTQARALKTGGKHEEALALINSQYNPAVSAYLGNLRDFVKMQRATLADAQQDIHQRRLVTLEIGCVVIALIVVFLLLGARFLIRSIVGPLGRANAFAAKIAQGDLSVRIDVDRSDEFGELLRSLLAMSQSLGRTVLQVRQSTDSIATASAEIAVGNNDLSHRTEQTSSDLQQTASAMAQLTHTVRQSVDSAQQASQLAANASVVAERGGTVVNEVVVTMQDINHSSKKIADIIGVIDGIAFQTNILALNAAVEAARAGEQGRGFAVVASEVRNLAQRSAQAAKEIKSLIDASVDKVESGARLVADAGATMTDIVQSVRRVTEMISEITTAASAQSAGIADVNQAVGNLDQMTQQNAALVEESAAAAQSLREQAAYLAEVVGTFKVDVAGNGSGTVMPVTPAPVRQPPSSGR